MILFLVKISGFIIFQTMNYLNLFEIRFISLPNIIEINSSGFGELYRFSKII